MGKTAKFYVLCTETWTGTHPEGSGYKFENYKKEETAILGFSNAINKAKTTKKVLGNFSCVMIRNYAHIFGTRKGFHAVGPALRTY